MQRFDAAESGQPEPMLAQVADAPVEPVSVAADPVDSPSRAYTTPAAADGPGSLPMTQFANYLVAHSSYASPLVRRSVVTGLIVAPQESAGDGAPLPASPRTDP
jgi:hypothetical protein